jgi:predicted transcriptional regulator
MQFYHVKDLLQLTPQAADSFQGSIALHHPGVNRVIELLSDISRGQPVPSIIITDMCCWSPRTVRYYLSIAERAGLVHRPNGPKSGWMLRRCTRMDDAPTRTDLAAKPPAWSIQ